MWRDSLRCVKRDELTMTIRFSIFPKIGILLTATAMVACGPKEPAATAVTPQELKARIKSSKAPLTLVHVWATWCDPCREEFPELIKVQEQFEKQGLELILVSADDPAEAELVEAFLSDQNCPVSSLISTELSEHFIETLSPNWAGSLPASFFYSHGKWLAEWEGMRTFDQYAETIETMLKK